MFHLHGKVEFRACDGLQDYAGVCLGEVIESLVLDLLLSSIVILCLVFVMGLYETKLRASDIWDNNFFIGLDHKESYGYEYFGTLR